jgi:hypothetical protein
MQLLKGYKTVFFQHTQVRAPSNARTYMGVYIDVWGI